MVTLAGVRMRRGVLPTQRFLLLLSVAVLGAMIMGGCTRATPVDLAAGVEIAAEIGSTDALATRVIDTQDPSARPVIVWHPVYEVANLTTQPMSLVDIDLDFPEKKLETNSGAQPIQLVEVRSGGFVDIFRTIEELYGDRVSETAALPVELAPGERVLLRFEEALTFLVSGQPWVLENDEQSRQVLGPYLNLEPDGSTFRCEVTRIDAVVELDAGVVKKEVSQILAPVGCVAIMSDLSELDLGGLPSSGGG